MFAVDIWPGMKSASTSVPTIPISAIPPDTMRVHADIDVASMAGRGRLEILS